MTRKSLPLKILRVSAWGSRFCGPILVFSRFYRQAGGRGVPQIRCRSSISGTSPLLQSIGKSAIGTPLERLLKNSKSRSLDSTPETPQQAQKRRLSGTLFAGSSLGMTHSKELKRHTHSASSGMAKAATLQSSPKTSFLAPYWVIGSAYSVSASAITSSRSRGPSSSIRTTRCHVPNRSRPASTASCTDVPMIADRM